MTRRELAVAIARDAEIPVPAADRALKSFMFHVTRTLRRGQRVVLTGFGAFLVAARKARTGRNPITGREIKIPAMRYPRFRPGRALKKAVA